MYGDRSDFATENTIIEHLPIGTKIGGSLGTQATTSEILPPFDIIGTKNACTISSEGSFLNDDINVEFQGSNSFHCSGNPILQ